MTDRYEHLARHADAGLDIADDDRDAAVERAEKAETEVRDAPPRPLDPTNPDDLRAVEVFLGWYVTNYDTVLLLPLRQREVAFEAIQETRRHLDMTADWVARRHRGVDRRLAPRRRM